MATASVIDFEPLDTEPEEDSESEAQRNGKRANLGTSILLSAIEDFRTGNNSARASAEAFLWPSSIAFAEHFDWVVSMSDIDGTWLRVALERMRPQWDAERRRGGQLRLRASLRQLRAERVG